MKNVTKTLIAVTLGLSSSLVLADEWKPVSESNTTLFYKEPVNKDKNGYINLTTKSVNNKFTAIKDISIDCKTKTEHVNKREIFVKDKLAKNQYMSNGDKEAFEDFPVLEKKFCS